jgi:penicillin-binding protein 2
VVVSVAAYYCIPSTTTIAMSSLLHEHTKGIIFLKRVVVFLLLQLLLILVIIGRLYQLQILNFDELRNRSEDNRIRIDVIPPLRGNIFDRHGQQLTQNRIGYELILYKINRRQLTNVFDILQLSQERRNKITKRLRRNSQKFATSILSNLTWNELVKITATNYRLENFSLEENYLREYIYSKEFAHVLGYVTTPDNRELKKLSKKIHKNILLHPNFRIGKNGLENSFNDHLTGKPGHKKIEVNAYNIPLREIEKKEPREGGHLQLTLDTDLQKFIHHRTQQLRSATVVLDVFTGEILALTSTPSFEINEFADGISNNYWLELLENEKKPLYNRAINALYAMGSTFKLIVAIAALENNWDENRKVDCSGILKISRKLDFHCWKKKTGHGKIEIIKALESSCNIFFANLGIFTGIHNIYNTAKQLGIGEVFDLHLPGYNRGVLPNPSWKKEYYNENWTKGDTINLSIGQGYVLANPLQLAVMVTRIANGGYPIIPFLLWNDPARSYNRNILQSEPLFRKKSLDITRQGMYLVINGKNGTASRYNVPRRYQISGKTGTAQVVSLEYRDKMEKLLLENEKLEEKYKNHGIFVGFAPYDKPRYALAIVVEHGDSGSRSAAPIALDIFKYLLDHPSTTESAIKPNENNPTKK